MARWILSVLVVLVLAIGWAGPAAAQEPLAPERLEALDAYLVRFRDELGVPGLAVAVVEGDAIRHLTALGVADGAGRAVTPQTPFLLASTSKAFTAMAVMQLVETGRIDLDAPVQRYLPWFTLADPEAASRITLRQLLHHTSGLPGTADLNTLDTEDQAPDALERRVRALADQVPDAPPEQYRYTNANYDTLGLVVQAVSGQSFDEYLAQHVFTPLEMTHSHTTLEAARADGLSDGFYPWFGTEWRPAALPVPRRSTPSATMFMSAEDMGHAVIAHLNGGRFGDAQVLSEASIAAMQTPGAQIDDFHGYGMGWQIRPYWEAHDPLAAGGTVELPRLIEHGGSYPNAHTYVGLVPRLGWGFAALINGVDPTQASRFESLEQSILSILAGGDPVAALAYEDTLSQNARLVAAGLLVAELVSLAWSLSVLRRRRRAVVPVRRSFRSIVTVVAPLVLDLLVVWLVLVYVPEAYELSLQGLVMLVPDIAVFAILALALAVIWGAIRTALLLWPQRAPRQGPPMEPAGAG